MTEAIICPSCGRKAELPGTGLRPDGWEGSERAAVCPSCRHVRWHSHCTSPADTNTGAGVEPPVKVMLVENGDLLRFDESGAHVAAKVPAGRVLIDSTGSGEVVDEVLRDRRHLAEDGLLVPVVAINKQTGMLEGVPDIITRGFVMEDSEALLADGLESAQNKFND